MSPVQKSKYKKIDQIDYQEEYNKQVQNLQSQETFLVIFLPIPFNF